MALNAASSRSSVSRIGRLLVYLPKYKWARPVAPRCPSLRDRLCRPAIDPRRKGRYRRIVRTSLEWIVVKTLVSLMLIATQFLPGSALTVHLCVRSDGSVCDERICECCRNRHDEADRCCESQGTSDDCDATEVAPSGQVVSHCDCTPFPVSQPQNPTLRSSDCAARLVTCLAAAACHVVSIDDVLPVDHTTFVSRSPHTHSPPLSLLASVVLRC